jgi:hypothetical protein
VQVNNKSDWGYVGDAMVVYDQLISNRPNDFSGYLAKVCYVGSIGLITAINDPTLLLVTFQL